MSRNYMQVGLALLLIILLSQSMQAQTVEITNIEFSQNKVHLTYSLQDTIIGRYYSIRLYSSEDNFLNPLNEVSLEVGMEIPPGTNKKIIWDAQKELGADFDGKVALEIRGRIFVPFINMEGFEEIKTLKRKRPHNVIWTGGRPQNILNFNLYRGEKKVMTFANIANVGHYKLELPGHVRPGKNYRFLVSDTKNSDEVVQTGTFRVKRKIPLVIKVIPAILAIGAAKYFVSSSGNTDNPIPNPVLPN